MLRKRLSGTVPTVRIRLSQIAIGASSAPYGSSYSRNALHYVKRLDIESGHARRHLVAYPSKHSREQ